MAARAMRVAEKLITLGISDDLSTFTDQSDIAEYAINDIAAMVKDGLIKGSNSRINPLSNTTRAEAAVLIYNIMKRCV
jgi:hypothetical protein